MKVERLVDIVYKRKKDGSLSYHANKFIEKHKLDIEKELSREEALYILININNKDKRELVLKELLTEIEPKQDLNLREVTYKEACKFYHPDNKSSGSINMFKFIQEVKEYLWEWTGEPVKEIFGKNDWNEDRIFDNLTKKDQEKSFYDML